MRVIRRGPLVLLVMALLGASLAVGSRWSLVEQHLAGAGAAGAVVYGLCFVLLVAGCFPVSVLGFTAGAVYGPWKGLALVVPAVALGGVLMLGLGRSLLREPIRRRISSRPRLAALDRAAGQSALRLNLLARLAPFNFGLACYTLAAGSSPARSYVLGLLGTIPSLIAHVVIGAIVRGGGDLASAGRVRTAAAVLAVAAVAALAWQTARLAGAALRRLQEQDGPAGRERR